MKSHTRSRKRCGAKTPSLTTCSSGSCGSARRSPETVRQGLNHSRPAVSVPTRASTPSEMTSSAFVAKSDGTLGFVGLELLEGRPDGGVLVRRVLEFHDSHRQA